MVEKFFETPAPYMNARKKDIQEIETTNIKRRVKPKVMVGSLRKPNIEYIADLGILHHSTKLLKKQMREMAVRSSVSLN